MPDHVCAGYVVAHVPGDGVGPEVTEVARNCVDAVAGAARLRRRLAALRARRPALPGAPARCCPTRVLAELRKTDAVLLGAVGSPEVPPGVLERGLLLRLRAELDLYINLRPSKLRAGVANAVSRDNLGDLDLVIVRENTEGLYAGAGGTVHRGTEFETATEESLNTWAGVRRCVQLRGRAGRRAQRAADPGAQDQRAHPRRRPVAADGHRGRGGARRASSATRTSTRPACGWWTTRPGST